MRLVLTPEARADFDVTISDTLKLFGERQAIIYSGYFAESFRLLSEDPLRASSRERSDIRRGARSLHLSIAAGRRDAAAHVLFYRIDRDGSERSVVIILRILHERMNAKSRLKD